MRLEPAYGLMPGGSPPGRIAASPTGARRFTCRWVLCLAACLAACLPGCGGERSEQVAPEIPDADRESWGTRLAVRRAGGYALHVETAYQRYYAATQMTLADSGAQVELRDSTGTVLARISASRMALEHARGRAGLAGAVRVDAGDSLVLQSDTLVVELDGERVWGPDSLEIRLPDAGSRGLRLRADLDFTRWSLEEVKGYWGQGRERLDVQAHRQEISQTDEGTVVELDGVQVESDGWRLVGPAARYLRASGRVVFAGGVSGEDGDRRFRADSLEYIPSTRHARGWGVVEVQEADLDLRADTFVEERDRGFWTVAGAPARLSQGARRLTAGAFRYERASGRLRADTAATFAEGGRQLQAARLDLERSNDRLRAGGAVRLHDAQWGGEARADSMDYDLKAERLHLYGAPRFVGTLAGADTAGAQDSVRFAAARMEAVFSVEELHGTGGVEATTAAWEVTAAEGWLRYGAGEFVVAGDAVLRQEGRQVVGDTARVLLEGGRVVEAAFPATLQARLAAADSQQCWLAAQAGRLYFNEGRLARAELEGEVLLTQRRLGADEVNRFSGGRMRVGFDAQGRLLDLRVEEKAEVRSRLKTDTQGRAAGNVTRGEAIDIAFEEGEMQAIRILAAEGVYVPSDKTGEAAESGGGG